MRQECEATGLDCWKRDGSWYHAGTEERCYGDEGNILFVIPAAGLPCWAVFGKGGDPDRWWAPVLCYRLVQWCGGMQAVEPLVLTTEDGEFFVPTSATDFVEYVFVQPAFPPGGSATIYRATDIVT